jgi:ribosomal protein L37E
MSTSKKSKSKSSRVYIPCRECGEAHTNPRSSSICSDCGRAYYLANLDRKAAEKLEAPDIVAQLSDNEAYVIYLLRTECAISMQDATKFLRAFQLCVENING